MCVGAAETPDALYFHNDAFDVSGGVFDCNDEGSQDIGRHYVHSILLLCGCFDRCSCNLESSSEMQVSMNRDHARPSSLTRKKVPCKEVTSRIVEIQTRVYIYIYT